MTQVEIYTKAYCGYCHAAKGLLTRKGISYTEISVDEDMEKLTEMVQRANGARTVPQIFIGDVHVGGSDELHMLERQKKLDALLAA